MEQSVLMILFAAASSAIFAVLAIWWAVQSDTTGEEAKYVLFEAEGVEGGPIRDGRDD